MGQGPSALHVNKLHSLEACVFMVTAQHTKALVWQNKLLLWTSGAHTHALAEPFHCICTLSQAYSAWRA